jgi:hypothetical protein
MIFWEPALSRTDKGLKWEGEKGFMDLKDPLYVRGMRLVMNSV